MDKNVILGSMVVLAMFAVIGLVMPVAAQEVYLVPQHSSASYCTTTTVEIWVNATDFQSGQINLTYDPNCANVTNWIMNSATFPMGGWTHSVGSEWITFLALSPLTGEYKIGTLTIHGISEEECNTALDFVTTGAMPSMLFDDDGNEITVNWIDGTFTCVPVGVFDTGEGTYPSIFGTHKGTIKPNRTITISKLYTYPCTGTGGHTEYAALHYSNGTLIAEAHWNGYVGDWHNITFDKTIVLMATETYNYTIRTGSYPQIHHTDALPTANGGINCTEFTDANGRVYYDWIPAIRLI